MDSLEDAATHCAGADRLARSSGSQDDYLVLTQGDNLHVLTRDQLLMIKRCLSIGLDFTSTMRALDLAFDTRGRFFPIEHGYSVACIAHYPTTTGGQVHGHPVP